MSGLLLLFIVPFLASFVAFASSSLSGKNLKIGAVVLSLIPLAILFFFQAGSHGLQEEELQLNWFPALSIQFYLRVDALSLLFLYLTAVIVPVSLFAVRSENLSSPATFYALTFLLQGLLIGFFSARDLALFTIFYEAMLLPLYFMITIWGKSERQRAALQFLIYMIAGSALMVAAILALYVTVPHGTFNLDILTKTASSSPYAGWVFAVFMLAFAVKTPLFPLHSWLPDAYYQASTPGTILLAGILSKAGIYGILRINMALFPHLMQEASPILLGFAIAGVFYGGLNAWRQTDFKRLIAYSSLSHVNFILAGLFVWNQTAHEGAVLQAINHGLTISALVLVVGWLEERVGTTSLQGGSGLAKYMPCLCWVTLLFVLSSVAVPGTNNFVGELLILFGLFNQNPWAAAMLSLTIILSVIYMLRFMQKIYFQTPRPFQNQWVDIKAKELTIAFPLAALILWIGIYPAPLLKTIEAFNVKTIVPSNVE